MQEIYWNSKRNMLCVEDLKTGKVQRMDELDRAFILAMDKKIADDYELTYRALCSKFGDASAMAYARVYQFCACNFSTKDGQPDIDEDFNFILETVSCPMRHTCKLSYCKPVLSNDLSPREMEVIKHYARGLDKVEVGSRLFISENTVHNHLSNIYSKLGFVNKSEPGRMLTIYAINHKIV